MFDSNTLTERKVLEKIIDLLVDCKITTDDLQFRYNKEKEMEDEDRWFNYVEKNGWKFQGHKNGRRIRLLNPSDLRVAKASNKDDFVRNCRKLLSEKL